MDSIGRERRAIGSINYKEAKTMKRTRSLESSRQEAPRRKNQTLFNVSTQNGYEILQDFNMHTEENTATKDSSSNASFRPPLKKATEKKTDNKPKPIVLWHSSHLIIKKLMADLTITDCPIVKLRAKDAFQLLPKSKEDKTKIRNKLAELNSSYHTYTEPEDRHTVFILKNFNPIETGELVKLLNDANIPAIHASLTSKKKPNNPEYRISFEKGSIDINTLMQSHRLIDGMRVLWTKLPKSTRTTQCHRCQAWGHSAINCQRPSRCLKCIGEHSTKDCPRTQADAQDPNKPPSCTNCKAVGHLSSSYDCPAYQRYIAKIQQRRTIALASQPRQFVSTPAPWLKNNNNFPTLHCQSSSQHQNVTGESDPVFAINNSSQNHNGFNAYSQFANLQKEFHSIPGIEIAIKKLSSLIQDLKSTINPDIQASKMLSFMIAAHP